MKVENCKYHVFMLIREKRKKMIAEIILLNKLKFKSCIDFLSIVGKGRTFLKIQDVEKTNDKIFFRRRQSFRKINRP